MKIGAIIIIIGYALIVITAHQESNIGLQWSQSPQYMFVVGICLGFVPVPLINIIISRAKIEDAGAASGVLNTMIAVGNAMGIAFIGSIFFGLGGTGSSTATADIGSHSNESNHIRIHHYTDAFVSSTLCTMGLVITTFVLVFFLPSSPTRHMS